MKTNFITTFWLIVIILVTTAQLDAQPFELTFSMKDKNGAPDSVYVENLMKGTNLMLMGADTLRLNVPTALNDLIAQNLNLKAFTNPVTKNATIKFYNHQKGNVTVTIFDMAGRQLVSESTNLPPGHVRYMLSGLQQGSYILKVLTAKGLSSQVLLSSNRSADKFPNLSLLGINYSNNIKNTNKSELKSINTTSDVKVMDFSKDDELVFKAYFTGAEAVDTVVPTNDLNLEFENFYYTLTDYELNTYLAVEIGNQVWMAENLKTTHYPEGNSIPKVTDDEAWKHVRDKSAEEAYCFYGNDKDSTFGVLYSWPAALGGKGVYSNSNPSGVQGVCPADWHLPSMEEWKELGEFISQDGHFLKIGVALKSISGWTSEGDGTDDYKFRALPGGQRGYVDWSTGQVLYHGSFIGKDNNGCWWTSTFMAVDAAAFIMLSYNSNNMKMASAMSSNGYAIRCVRDLPAGTLEGN
ncbi:MAG: T9SS type A sorting domain-containing protein [Prolixibacteraceae bacterium]|jgi:uncharacterized protein (TIGR02145 family)|nr:T9SS type A sorting domain-containing protein [Prolixibacteraceae bacterium]MBT6007359.1 T9SS type A sorting domain-containing protein [Prolixibacteraceae bacterium]MBT6765549.1 T9SS type A sorting domain-containing protein [Prolixibacteraceae bacterium]MBT7000730.1 T9SS type A sorting domain-containing protein [Prolixibacteraceae bacterium]MBT7394894.1 T9SS type A sorting domain-containing protein [Prolixibacteraceae bacterium]